MTGTTWAANYHMLSQLKLQPAVPSTITHMFKDYILITLPEYTSISLLLVFTSRLLGVVMLLKYGKLPGGMSGVRYVFNINS